MPRIQQRIFFQQLVKYGITVRPLLQIKEAELFVLIQVLKREIKFQYTMIL